MAFLFAHHSPEVKQSLIYYYICKSTLGRIGGMHFAVNQNVNVCRISILVLSYNEMKYKPILKIVQSLHVISFLLLFFLT